MCANEPLAGDGRGVELNDLTFRSYQERARKLDVLTGSGSRDMDVALLIIGLAGEIGELAGEFKKLQRDRVGYTGLSDRVGEELGDLLWYVATLARVVELDLAQIAARGLAKAEDRFSPTALEPRGLAPFDSSFDSNEQLPRIMRICFEEVSHESMGVTYPRVHLTLPDQPGWSYGDPLDDNASYEDDFRYHDAFHLAHAAVLGWSPVVRNILEPKRKRRSSTLDRTEDGGRALVIEEGLVAAVFAEAKTHSFFEAGARIPSKVIKLCQSMTSHLEVSSRSYADWERAIALGYSVFNSLRRRKGGTVLLDQEQGLIRLV